jgi:hypothetical protein
MILRADFVTIRPIEACAILHLASYPQQLDAQRANVLTVERIEHMGTVAGHMIAIIGSTDMVYHNPLYQDFGYRGGGLSIEHPVMHIFHHDYTMLSCPELYLGLDDETPRNGCYINRFNNTAPPTTRAVYKARSSI